MSNTIEIWTDGGSRANGSENSVGGWGAVLEYGDYRKEIYGGEKIVTNNQMELKGVINALSMVKTSDIPIKIYSDSKYVVEGITKWVYGWKKKKWKKSDGKPVLNLELWKQLEYLVSKQQDINFIWVKGHATNVGNERADELANLAMDEVEYD